MPGGGAGARGGRFSALVAELPADPGGFGPQTGGFRALAGLVQDFGQVVQDRGDFAFLGAMDLLDASQLPAEEAFGFG
jgi:hypothetical protein